MDDRPGASLAVSHRIAQHFLILRSKVVLNPVRRALLTAFVLAFTLAVAASAQARSADVYSGYSSRIGTLKSSGTSWTVYQGYSDRAGKVRSQGSKCVVYAGSSDRVGEVRDAGVSGGCAAGGAALLLLL